MKTLHYVIIGTISIPVLVLILFGLGVFSLEWQKFFSPRRAEIQRAVFENTQSYTHGKIQDLAKYLEEYSNSEPDERDAIRMFVQVRFAEFDESKINSPKLRDFLTNMRGY